MTPRTRHGGIVLVMVLYVCTALWGALAALTMLAWSHHRVALAARQHTVAALLIDARVAALRDADAASWPEAGTTVGGDVGSCSWSLTVTAREPSLLRLRAEARVVAVALVREATVHAPP